MLKGSIARDKRQSLESPLRYENSIKWIIVVRWEIAPKLGMLSRPLAAKGRSQFAVERCIEVIGDPDLLFPGRRG